MAVDYKIWELTGPEQKKFAQSLSGRLASNI